MYQFSEPNSDQLEMFNKSLPFSGKLNRNNRWIRLAELIDWQGLESTYAQTFSTIGRPGVRARYDPGEVRAKTDKTGKTWIQMALLSRTVMLAGQQL